MNWLIACDVCRVVRIKRYSLRPRGASIFAGGAEIFMQVCDQCQAEYDKHCERQSEGYDGDGCKAEIEKKS